MNITRRKRRKAEVSTHSLNDIMFFLLLFFLIISTMANPNVIKVMLPEAADNQNREAKKSVQLAVDASRNYYIDGQQLTFEELDLRLAAIAKTDPEVTCSINMERTLTVQDLIDVMQLGEKNGIAMYIKTARAQQ